MPGDPYSGIGQALSQAGGDIADAIRKRQQRKAEEEMAKAKLAAIGEPYTLEYANLIKHGGTADDVVKIASVTKQRLEGERRLMDSYEQPGSFQGELEPTGMNPLESNANREILAFGSPEERSRLPGILRAQARQMDAEKEQRDLAASVDQGQSPSFSALVKSGMPVSAAFTKVITQNKQQKRDVLADQWGLTGKIAESYISGNMTLTQALAAKRGPKAQEAERKRQARQDYVETVGASPDDPKWRLYIETGGKRPDEETAIPTPNQRASDTEQSYRGIISGKERAEQAIANPNNTTVTPAQVRLAKFTPEQIRDSAFQEANYVGQMKASAAGVGDVPAAQAEARQAEEAEWRAKLDSFQKRLDSLRSQW